ncbi:MAG: MFS transporter [Acidimicrobiales bacterium]
MSTGPAPEPLFTRPVVTLLIAGISYFVMVGLSFPVLPRLIEDELGGSEAEIGFAFGATALGMLLVRPFVGYLADAHGRRTVMVVGAFVVAVLQLAHVPAASLGLWPLLAVRFFIGTAASAMYVGQATTATELPPQSRSAEIFSTFSVAVFVGFAIGPVLGETVLQRYGFTEAFAAAAAVGGLCVLLGLALPETRPPDAVARIAGVRGLLHPVAARAGAVSFLLFAAFIGFTAFATPYGESLGLEQVRWVLLAFSVTTLVVRAVGGRLIATMDRKRLGTSAHLTVVVGLAIMVTFDTVWSLYVGGVVMAAGLAFNVPLMVVVAAESARPQERSRVVATVIMFGDLANSLGAFGLGLVAEVSGYRGMYGVVLALALAAAVLYRSPFMDPVTAVAARPGSPRGDRADATMPR